MNGSADAAGVVDLARWRDIHLLELSRRITQSRDGT